MNRQIDVVERGGLGARERLTAELPVTERRLDLAGVSTAVLDGGDGAPVVLLHGPAGNATHWMGVLPELVDHHRVVAPDLPGHGASELPEGGLDADQVLAWLGELIERTCPVPPVVVGFAIGGAIAARLAIERPRAIGRLVLVDALGLCPFEPAPDFAAALQDFMAEPGERTHEALWQHCALDLDGLRERMGERWGMFEAYNLERARTPDQQTALGVLMGEFGLPAIPAEDLARIEIPTAMIWGRQDLATRLAVAEQASERFGWPLEVIDDCADDPPVERPEAFSGALGALMSDELPSLGGEELDALGERLSAPGGAGVR